MAPAIFLTRQLDLFIIIRHFSDFHTTKWLSFSNPTNGDSGVLDTQVVAMSETPSRVIVRCSPGWMAATRSVREGGDCTV